MRNAENTVQSEEPTAPNTITSGRSERPIVRGVAVAGLVSLGLIAGAAAMALGMPRDNVTLLTPAPISTLQSDTTAAIKGEVTDIYGNKFIIQDSSGKTLVDTGPRGELPGLIKSGEQVTVQGHFDRGFLHGDLLIGPDGQAKSLKPPRPGPRGVVDRLRGPDVQIEPAPPAAKS